MDPSLGPGRRFAYLDPPYPGMAKRYYGDQPTYRGEVDHKELIESSAAAGYAGWALSTSVKALPAVLKLYPPELEDRIRIGAWVKPGGVPPATRGMHNKWEPVIFVDGRRLKPGVRDFLMAHPTRGGGDLTGRKPIAFCAWLFDCLGMLPGDELVDVFPGTGIVGRAWEELSRRAAAAQDGSLFGPVEGDRRATLLQVGQARRGGPTRRQGVAIEIVVQGSSGDASPPPGRDGGSDGI